MACNTIDGRNPITFCNMLYAGNMFAALALFVIYRKQWTRANLRKLSVVDWASLLVLAILTNTFSPWLFFLALNITRVTNVVLVSQIEPPLVLALAWLVLGERFGFLPALGAALCVPGILLSVVLQPNEGAFVIGKGELFVALAAVSTMLAKQRLTRLPCGYLLSFATWQARWFVRDSLLLLRSNSLRGFSRTYLWKWMLLYGCIIIVGGQALWFAGLNISRSIDVLLASAAIPVAGVLFAFLILGEKPLTAQYIGGAVPVFGIVIGLVASRRRAAIDKRLSAEKVDDAPAVLKAERGTGFKGI